MVTRVMVTRRAKPPAPRVKMPIKDAKLKPMGRAFLAITKKT
jgi:hypothetical protein